MSTKIEWTEYTWNTQVGCTKVSAGCKNCYGERFARRLSAIALKKQEGNEEYVKDGIGVYPFVVNDKGWSGDIEVIESRINQFDNVHKPKMIFVNSMGDTFHEKSTFEYQRNLFIKMMSMKIHTFQLLTKRYDKMKDFLDIMAEDYFDNMGVSLNPEDYKNIWFGVSVCDNSGIDGIHTLRTIPTMVRFISFEPLLERIDDIYSLSDMEDIYDPINWVILGAETGPGRRETKVEWMEEIVDACVDSNIPVFVKSVEIGGKVIKDPEKFPRQLKYRCYPDVT